MVGNVEGSDNQVGHGGRWRVVVIARKEGQVWVGGIGVWVVHFGFGRWRGGARSWDGDNGIRGVDQIWDVVIGVREARCRDCAVDIGMEIVARVCEECASVCNRQCSCRLEACVGE